MEVRPDTAEIEAYGEKKRLTPGSTLSADIIVERRRLIDWVLDPNGKIRSVDVKLGISDGNYTAVSGDSCAQGQRRVDVASFYDTDAYPANGCSAGGGKCITDAQLQTEISKFVSANGLPTGMGTMYFVYTPSGVASFR